MGLKKRTKKDSPDIANLLNIGRYTSEFGKEAEKYLKIKIKDTDDFEDIIKHGIDKGKIRYNEQDVNQELIKLYLENFDRDRIRTFKPHEPHIYTTLPSF
ncbi:hypothetical protein CONCODRAFT_8017 [Conidiobolus coronatus NRRL 28638]|uniref:Uncharacterized protein n=1 Tax=Conidiobolus coronatus (strain ATCC 28846 / CBS 209.66 / NRRL 28638) TaxID=796925 RepID=A0A137P3X2_CONC2|nr:hypothetical protein CONCODRAFT_8017 [Conidiobolus coronatus NRRL 28638]|eukprot:KXN69594.1 hypothetical protein CONCODRAFT_8017 [Conidiobolus coronatus NRRL 28638]